MSAVKLDVKAASSLVTRTVAPKITPAPASKPAPAAPAFVLSVQGRPNDNSSAHYSRAGAPTPATAPPVRRAEVGPENRLTATGDGPVTVDIMNSDSGYDNQIYWSSDNWETRHRLGVDNQVGTVTLGTFDKGTQIDFGIVNGVGQFMVAGAAANNFDNVEHARVDAVGDGARVSFEDLAGGGDQDFNDAIIQVHGASNQPQASAATTLTTDARTPPRASPTQRPEPVTTTKSPGPVKDAKKTEPTPPPATNAKSPSPTKSVAAPAKSATPAKPAEPAKPATPAKPAEPAKPATPAKPTEPAKPATPAKPAEPAKSATPAKPAEPAKPATPATPAKQASTVTKAVAVYAPSASASTGASRSLRA